MNPEIYKKIKDVFAANKGYATASETSKVGINQ